MASQYVGIDLHRRRSVIVRQDVDGEVLEEVRIDNDPVALACAIEKASPDPEVVLEATYGWYWAVDVLQACGARVHLAHPLGVSGWKTRRVKNDRLDAAGLADLLRMNRLPEAWIAPPAVRELRELVRYRAKLVALRSGLEARVHAVLAKEGVAVPMSDLFGKAGMQLLAEVPLASAYRLRVSSLLDIIDAFDYEVEFVRAQIDDELRGHRGYSVIQSIPGVGATFAAIFVAEIGDVTRFKGAPALCSWAGLTPRHRESDSTVHRGHITKQGSKLVRWAAVEAVQRLPVDAKLRLDRDRIAARRGKRASAGSPPPASCSSSSTTGCATGTSVASSGASRWRREYTRTLVWRAFADVSDPLRGEVVCLIEPARPRTASAPRRLHEGEGMNGTRRSGRCPPPLHQGWSCP